MELFVCIWFRGREMKCFGGRSLSWRIIFLEKVEWSKVLPRSNALRSVRMYIRLWHGCDASMLNWQGNGVGDWTNENGVGGWKGRPNDTRLCLHVTLPCHRELDNHEPSLKFLCRLFFIFSGRSRAFVVALYASEIVSASWKLTCNMIGKLHWQVNMMSEWNKLKNVFLYYSLCFVDWVQLARDER